jgi:hypothetical protein
LNLNQCGPGNGANILAQKPRERLDISALKKTDERRALPYFFLDFRDQAHRKQRVTSEFEKVITYSNLFHSEKFSQMRANRLSRPSRGAKCVSATPGLLPFGIVVRADQPYRLA